MAAKDEARRKRLSIFYAGIIVAALAALAISILKGNEGRGEDAAQVMPALPQPLYYTLIGVIFVAAIANLIIITILSRGVGRRKLETRRKRWSLLSALIMIAALLLFMNRLNNRTEEGEEETIPSLFQGEISVLEGEESSSQVESKSGTSLVGHPLFVWALFLSGGMSALGIWTLLKAGKIKTDSRRRRDVEEELLEEVESGLDDLYRESDPRKAVIACYVRLEKFLRRYGLPRSPHLAPMEYMRQGLLFFKLPQRSTEGLTELFEVAKFSLHEIHQDDKANAIAYLREMVDHLESDQDYVSRR